MAYKWKPSKSKAREFAQKMQEIDEFCKNNNIIQSSSSDSYYFTLNNINYRVSNHSIEGSNSSAWHNGVQVRELYHEGGRVAGVVYIHASKIRIIDIYNDLKAGLTLDGRGYRI